MLSIVLGFALLAASEPAPPPLPTENGKPMKPYRPEWTSLPSGADFKRLYPDAARKKHVAGKVVLDCKVLADGKLTNCVVVQETPQGLGFDRAALGLVPMFAMKQQTSDGRPVAGGMVRLPLYFKTP